MGGADGVVAVFLKYPQLALNGVRVAGRAEDAVIVVDAGAAQYYPLAVYLQAVAAPGEAADPEGNSYLVLRKADLCGVKIGVFRVPELRIGYLHRKDGLAGGGCGGFNDALVAVEYFEAYLALAVGRNGYLHPRRLMARYSSRRSPTWSPACKCPRRNTSGCWAGRSCGL